MAGAGRAGVDNFTIDWHDAHEDLHAEHLSPEAPRPFSIQRRESIPPSPVPAFGRNGITHKRVRSTGDSS
jgi:hypothetical protein